MKTGSVPALRYGAGWMALLALFLTACGRAEREREAAVEAARIATMQEIEQALSQALSLADREADGANDILSPLPVMTTAQENALRRFLNASHVARARELGVRVPDRAARDSLVAAGRLVELEDSTAHWIVRPGTSPTYMVPEVPALLEELGRRFQERLAEMGLPPYRIEVTSALRTSGRQARLRGRNPNAAAGVSSHEFGTTVDLSYSAFAPPGRAATGDSRRRTRLSSRRLRRAVRRSGAGVGLGPQVPRTGSHLQPGAPGGAVRGAGPRDLRAAADGVSCDGGEGAGGLKQPPSFPVARALTDLGE